MVEWCASPSLRSPMGSAIGAERSIAGAGGGTVSALDFVLRGLAAAGFAWDLISDLTAVLVFAGADLAIAGSDLDFADASSLGIRGLGALDDFTGADAVFLGERPATGS